MPSTGRKKPGSLEPRVALSEDRENADMRLAAARMYVQLMQIARERMPGSTFADIYVAWTVTQGTLEGRPMNAHKISLLTGLPHQTVGRRLDSLVRRGYIMPKGKVFITLRMPPISASFIKRVVSALEQTLQAFNVPQETKTREGA